MIVAYKVIGVPMHKLQTLIKESDLIKLSATKNIDKLCEFQDITKASIFASTFEGYKRYVSNKKNTIFIYGYDDFMIVLVKK